MFGAKGPNSSQYDFKGTTVCSSLFSKNHPQVLTNPLLREQVALSVARLELEDHNPTKEEAFPISFKTKQMNSRAPNTEPLWLLKIPTTPNKTSKKFKNRSTHSLKNVRI